METGTCITINKEEHERKYLQTYRTIISLNKQPSTRITTSMPQKPPADFKRNDKRSSALYMNRLIVGITKKKKIKYRKLWPFPGTVDSQL